MTDASVTRYGITVPFDDLPLGQQAERFSALADLGYTDAWSAETDATDGLTPLALAAVWAPRLRLGTAILPAFTRGPALLAQSVAGLAEAAPGRFVVGVGSSSDVIVERWNGIPFDRPFQRTRDMVRFLKDALAGERVKRRYDTFEINGFRLRRPVDPMPKILVAALRPGMLRMAGREADGAIINWLSADDVATVAPHVRQAGDDKEVVARIFVCPSEDAAAVREAARFVISAYLTVPVYRAFHEWLGRGSALAGMWEAWDAGDRAAARAAVPDEVVDDLIVHGTPERCRAQIQRYVDHGVDTPALMVLPFGVDTWEAVEALAPGAAGRSGA